MQRKVNRSDSDYHYGKEKYKRNVYKMMLECKNEEFKSGDKSDYFKVFSRLFARQMKLARMLVATNSLQRDPKG
ncbi:hypothetical protein RF158_13770 [Escherichia coli]|nr:hypothetical protein [Escherichia coli]MDQ9447034.1 hypothetical protein [Escherichia coli]